MSAKRTKADKGVIPLRTFVASASLADELRSIPFSVKDFFRSNDGKPFDLNDGRHGSLRYNLDAVQFSHLVDLSRRRVTSILGEDALTEKNKVLIKELLDRPYHIFSAGYFRKTGEIQLGVNLIAPEVIRTSKATAILVEESSSINEELITNHISLNFNIIVLGQINHELFHAANHNKGISNPARNPYSRELDRDIEEAFVEFSELLTLRESGLLPKTVLTKERLRNAHRYYKAIDVTGGSASWSQKLRETYNLDLLLATYENGLHSECIKLFNMKATEPEKGWADEELLFCTALYLQEKGDLLAVFNRLAAMIDVDVIYKNALEAIGIPKDDLNVFRDYKNGEQLKLRLY
jgi:hypothetical protein